MNTNAEPRAATRGRRWFSRSNRLLLAGIVAAMAALSLVAQVALAGPPSPTGVPDQITGWRRQQGVPGRSRGRRPDLHVQRLRVEFRRAAGESVRRQRQADHQPLRRPDLAGQGRQQGRRHGRGQGHPRSRPPFPGCSCPQRRLRGPTVTGSWTRASSSGSTPPVASLPLPRTATRQRQAPWSRSRTRPSTSSGSTPLPDLTNVGGRPITRPPAGGLSHRRMVRGVRARPAQRRQSQREGRSSLQMMSHPCRPARR